MEQEGELIERATRSDDGVFCPLLSLPQAQDPAAIGRDRYR